MKKYSFDFLILFYFINMKPVSAQFINHYFANMISNPDTVVDLLICKTVNVECFAQ